MSSLGGKAAITGIGQTEFSKESGRSELQLACEAVKAAIDDAGLRPGDIDGMVTFTMDSNEEIEVARSVGIGDLTFFTRVPHGGGAAAGTVVQAAMAVATGTANAVVCYRAFNERSGFRFGGATARPRIATRAALMRKPALTASAVARPRNAASQASWFHSGSASNKSASLASIAAAASTWGSRMWSALASGPLHVRRVACGVRHSRFIGRVLSANRSRRRVQKYIGVHRPARQREGPRRRARRHSDRTSL